AKHMQPARTAPGATGPGAPGSARAPPAPSRAPENRAADALREELATAAQHVEGQDLFDFGSPDLEGGVGRQDALKRVADEVAQCTLCKELAATRTRTVPGQGDPNARLVFVGEGPGEEEDRQGLAFVGRAGQLLTKMIDSINLTRDQVFIANILKCRPPANRTPAPDEIANCLPYLMRQLEILRPKILCALGGVAAQMLLQTRDGITRLRGRFHPYRGTLLMPTFHPAYLLRNYTKDARQKVYDDMLKIQAELKK
ncbi:MAG: uracil-DNA glycosylase, partial [Phycisphaerae bacterium]